MKMSPTPELRWVEKISNINEYHPVLGHTVPTGRYEIKPVLQQKWIDISTGVHAWKDVVTIKDGD